MSTMDTDVYDHDNDGIVDAGADQQYEQGHAPDIAAGCRKKVVQLFHVRFFPECPACPAPAPVRDSPPAVVVAKRCRAVVDPA